MLDAVSMFSDELMEAILEEQVTEEQIYRAVREGTLALQMTPVLVGSAYKNKGVQPLRILESSTKGGLGAGKLGVVMARAGVGKTAFLVQIGLDDAMRERPVLHIALGQELEHVQSWYDALFDE